MSGERATQHYVAPNCGGKGKDRRYHSDPDCRHLQRARHVREAHPLEIENLELCGSLECGGERKEPGEYNTEFRKRLMEMDADEVSA